MKKYIKSFCKKSLNLIFKFIMKMQNYLFICYKAALNKSIALLSGISENIECVG